MARPVTLFTGQWADLPLEQMARKVKEFGYDGIELACWGDHFEVEKALSDDGYCARKRELLDSLDLQCHAISAHLVGQAVCDLIDSRHKSILPPHVWGDGDPEGVNQRATEELMNTARAAKRFGVDVVVRGDDDADTIAVIEQVRAAGAGDVSGGGMGDGLGGDRSRVAQERAADRPIGP